jgi:threonine/homoserine efflux transporter RhtA
MVRKINSRGELGVAVVISKTAAQFAVPQMARVGDQLIFAWSESHDDADRVASAQIAIKALD